MISVSQREATFYVRGPAVRKRLELTVKARGPAVRLLKLSYLPFLERNHKIVRFCGFEGHLIILL